MTSYQNNFTAEREVDVSEALDIPRAEARPSSAPAVADKTRAAGRTRGRGA